MICENPYVKTTEGVTRLKSKKGTEVKSQDVIQLFDCGKCLNCRAKQSNIWKTRLLLEQKSSKESLFVTLTYQDENLVVNDYDEPLLHKPDLQNFIKRLRKNYGTRSIRHFSVGEYGSQTLRPHYHLALFSNVPISQEVIQNRWYRNRSDKSPLGQVHVGYLEEKSAAYIAGYLKKKAETISASLNATRTPEFSLMSKQHGGIGYPFIKRIAEQIRDEQYIEPEIIESLRIGGKAAPLGRYLTQKLAADIGVNPQEFTKKYYKRLGELDEIGGAGNKYEYYSNIIEHFRGARLSRQAKLKLKTQRRTL